MKRRSVRVWGGMIVAGNSRHHIALFRWGLWFRLFGRGLWFRIGGEPLFSERNGTRKVHTVWKVRIQVLRSSDGLEEATP
jgi:hypothetical protein